MPSVTDLTELETFLPCETPDAWVDAALQNQDLLLIDHANCEKKAAATALNLMFRYVDRTSLLEKMSKLAREELRHFEQVLKIMQARRVEYQHLTASRYANGLREAVRKPEPFRLVDILVCGAFIEARSCERFAKLAPHLDPELCKFYRGLLASEARHFKDYLRLAKTYSDEPIEPRIEAFAALEQQLIETPDDMFRFHSGPPATKKPLPK